MAGTTWLDLMHRGDLYCAECDHRITHEREFVIVHEMAVHRYDCEDRARGKCAEEGCHPAVAPPHRPGGRQPS